MAISLLARCVASWKRGRCHPRIPKEVMTRKFSPWYGRCYIWPCFIYDHGNRHLYIYISKTMVILKKYSISITIYIASHFKPWNLSVFCCKSQAKHLTSTHFWLSMWDWTTVWTTGPGIFSPDSMDPKKKGWTVAMFPYSIHWGRLTNAKHIIMFYFYFYIYVLHLCNILDSIWCLTYIFVLHVFWCIQVRFTSASQTFRTFAEKTWPDMT